MRIVSCLFISLGLALVACGSSGSGPGGGAGAGQPGSSCASGSGCNGGVCAQSQDFPGGYCTQGCTLSNPNSCPAGSVCINDASGVPANSGITSICYQSCTSNADCRPGYQCLEKANHMVCRNGN